MKLYLKRDTSCSNSQFVILNEEGYEVYYGVNCGNNRYSKMAITDLNYNPLCNISSVPLPLFNAYTICDGKDTIRLIFNKNLSRPVCYYYGISWRITGDIIGKNYEIADLDNKVLLSHSPVGSSICAGYEINIYDQGRKLLLLSSVICADRIETRDNKQFQTV